MAYDTLRYFLMVRIVLKIAKLRQARRFVYQCRCIVYFSFLLYVMVTKIAKRRDRAHVFLHTIAGLQPLRYASAVQYSVELNENQKALILSLC